MAPAFASRPLVIYDGGCRICTGSLTWLQRLDRDHLFEARPLQDERIYAEYPGLTRAACEEAIHVLLPDGRIFRGAEAIREIALRLPLTRPLGRLMGLSVLRPLSRRLYGWIARHRQRLKS